MFKKITVIISLLFIITSCSSAKKAEKSIQSGDYDKAFNLAIEKLNEDKYKKSSQKLIPSLKTAYDKANERDLKEIKLLKNSNKLRDLKEVYALYVGMDVRQDEIIALLPLSYENKEYKFNTDDYSKEIKNSLTKYSSSLYNTANQKLNGSKLDAREAYKYFNDLEFSNPNYISNIGDLITQAKIKGSSVVLFKVSNKIADATTPDLIDELMRVSEANMSNEWVMYHKDRDYNISYDYEALISLDDLQISPEGQNSETVQQQARVKDGWEYVKDGNGNVMKDSLGNDIKRDKIITVQAEVKLIQQSKTGVINGKLDVKNLRTNTLTSSTPLLGEAKFENVYGLYHGDPRAIEEKYHQALQNKEQPFPVDADFVKYCIANFRIQMLQTLDKQPF